MKILLLGADGQVGWELQRSLAILGELRACSRREADLEQPAALRTLLREYAPQVVVDAAAYTAVDRAESEPERALRVNGEAVGLLAEEVRRLRGWLVHYSTDYVFAGDKSGAYSEEDAPAPLSSYGESKLAGERAIVASGCLHLLFRTSWVFGVRGANFAKTILRLAREREELRVVDDQVGAPTGAATIADVTSLILYRVGKDPALRERAPGTYHLASAGETSWWGYARQVVVEALARGAALRLGPDQVKPIATADYPVVAKRPANSRLDTTKLRSTFDLTLPTWQAQLKRVLAELLRSESA